MFRLHAPQDLPTDAFLASGRGHVLDAGAGSGRSAMGLLSARPQATVTALDIYDGFYGIVDNTPDRFLANARAGGFEHRVAVETGDVRQMPFEDRTFDGVVSSFAIDHLPRRTIPTAIGEVARVLKPDGELLLMIVNVDLWTLLVSPHALHHHPPADAARWREMLDEGGFTIAEEGTRPAMRYFYATKRGEAVTLHLYTTDRLPWCNHGLEHQEPRGRTAGDRSCTPDRGVQNGSHPSRVGRTPAAVEECAGRRPACAGAALS
jgi:SAM-dependent methyltransferase